MKQFGYANQPTNQLNHDSLLFMQTQKYNNEKPEKFKFQMIPKHN